jgi:uncharacterized protein Usg
MTTQFNNSELKVLSTTLINNSIFNLLNQLVNHYINVIELSIHSIDSPYVNIYFKDLENAYFKDIHYKITYSNSLPSKLEKFNNSVLESYYLLDYKFIQNFPNLKKIVKFDKYNVEESHYIIGYSTDDNTKIKQIHKYVNGEKLKYDTFNFKNDVLTHINSFDCLTNKSHIYVFMTYKEYENYLKFKGQL